MSNSLEKKFTEALGHPQLEFIQQTCELLPQAEWFLVGGAVRDIALGRVKNDHDFDFVVRGVGLDEVSDALSQLGKVDYVGRDFGVLKFWRADAPSGYRSVDIAWPRTERGSGTGGRRDFEVHSDPDLPISDDLGRRDFTVNAMAWDFQEELLIDPYGGQEDLADGLIRAVGDSDKRFLEDHTRMMRGIRFACELGFDIEERTWESILKQARHLNDLRHSDDGQVERVVPYETIAKDFLKSLNADVVRSLDLLDRGGILFRLIPELTRLQGLGQPSEWHTEGDVWTHTQLAIQKVAGPEFAEMFPGERADIETLVAILLHDVGKPETAVKSASGISFHGHDARGSQMARGIVERLRLASVPRINVNSNRVEWLVRMHMFPILVDLEHVRKTTLVKHFLQDEKLGRQLLHLSFADLSASIPEGGEPDLSNLKNLIKELAELREKDSSVEKLMSGKQVMEETGLEPGPEVGELLEAIREAQLSGKVLTDEQAKSLLRQKLGQKGDTE